MKRLVLAVAMTACAVGIAAAQQTEALSPIDRAVNTMFSAAGAPNRDATRIVPIVGAGSATTGYAQIVGPPSRVAATRAVMRVESTSANGWSVEMLVPVTAVSRTSGSMRRAYGVAVDAIVRGGAY